MINLTSSPQDSRLIIFFRMIVQHTVLHKEKYRLPQWFDRMGAGQRAQQEIFRILNSLSADCKSNYPFGKDYITTYRIEILASKA